MLRSIRTQIARGAAATDELITRIARAATGWLLWPILYTIALGAGLWAHVHPDRLALLDTNKLPQPERTQAIFWLFAALGAVALVYGGAVVARRVTRGSFQVIATFSELNRLLSPLLALPFVAALRLPNVEKTSAKLTLVTIALAAVLCARSFYALPLPSIADEEPDEPPSRAREIAYKILAALAVFALWAGYGYFFSRLAITNHHALNTRTTDLGYYDNIFYQSIHGRPLGCSFIKAGYHGSAHFDPILVLLSPLYLIYPRVELLLSLQSVWLGSGVIPVYLLAKEKLKSRVSGVLLAVIYASYPALHGANMYEFHSLTLITPLVLWLLYFFEIGATKRYYALLVALLLCREDVPLLLCFVGAYAIISEKPGGPRLGRYTIVISLIYFILAKSVFMTSSSILGAGKDSYSYAYYYEELIPDKSNAAQLGVSIVTNPSFVWKLVLEEAKVIWFLLIFMPLGFLPFFAKKGRIMLVYGLLFILLASRDPVYSIHFQYASIIFPIGFALVPLTLRQVKESGLGAFGLEGQRLSRALLGAAFVAAMLVSWKYSGLTDNASFRGGFSPVTRKLTDDQKARHAWIQQQIAKIPPGASVGATNRLGPHISNRKHAYFYPERTTDYVFADETELKGGQLDRHTKAISSGEIIEIARNGKMALFIRKGLQRP